MIYDSDFALSTNRQHTPHHLRWGIALRLWSHDSSVASEIEVTALGK